MYSPVSMCCLVVVRHSHEGHTSLPAHHWWMGLWYQMSGLWGGGGGGGGNIMVFNIDIVTNHDMSLHVYVYIVTTLI